AVCRAAEPAEVVSLGNGSVTVASVVDPGEPGRLVVGQAAQQRAITDPDRVVRGFTGRIGDEVPMVIGGQTYTAAQLTAMLARWVVDQVAVQQGGPADGIVMTHPATWGDYKRAVLAAALTAEGLAQVRLCPEPEAAGAGYAGPGRTLAIYDLGGTTFDATVIRATGTGQCTVLGAPQHLPQLGGADFDDAVFGHLLAAVPALAELDPDDPATLAATAALRRECTQATQALSADTEVTIPVAAPGIGTQVRLHRAEFDDMIRPQLSETLQALRRALHTAQLDPHQLDAVLLVGGSSRIPLVAQLVSTDLDQPVTIDPDPTTTIARGAATLARGALVAHRDDTPTRRAASHPDDDTPPPYPAQPASEPIPLPQRPSLTAIPLDVEPAKAQWRRTNSRRVTRIALASALAVLTAAGVGSVPFLIARSEPNPSAKAGIPARSAPPATSTPASGPPPIPDAADPVGSAGIGNEVSAGAAGSNGDARTTSPAAPHQLAGGPAKPDAAPPAGAPTPSWVTTYTWTTSWSNPPPTTSRSTTPAATTTAPSTPPAPTTQSPPHPSTTTAPAPTTSPSNHQRPTT
ncbi:MAG: Hsp70 family protein, partial [Pseudonocardiales bacterium]|nr:Hsp70 family protein [Pseudonocardiales bacterium]